MNSDVKAIEFYFDLSSPYGYIGAQGIESVASRHGREVNWLPILLGPILKQTGHRPLAQVPLMGEYSLHDIERCCRRLKIDFVLPDPFPIPTVTAARACYWLQQQNPEAAKQLALALYHAYFAENHNISRTPVVLEICRQQGLDEEALEAALTGQELKDRLRQATADAMAKGVFGSPFFIVDGEPFWGADRLRDLDRWLETGGW